MVEAKLVYRGFCSTCSMNLYGFTYREKAARYRVVYGLRRWHYIERGPRADKTVCGLVLSMSDRRHVGRKVS